MKLLARGFLLLEYAYVHENKSREPSAGCARFRQQPPREVIGQRRHEPNGAAAEHRSWPTTLFSRRHDRYTKPFRFDENAMKPAEANRVAQRSCRLATAVVGPPPS
jgi:hypothetical protein